MRPASVVQGVRKVTDAGQTGRILNINENHSQYGILKERSPLHFSVARVLSAVMRR